MATTLDTKGLHVAKILNGLREELQRQVFAEISTAVPVFQSDLPPTTLSKLPAIDDELQMNLLQANNNFQTASWLPDTRFPLGRPLMKKVIYRLLNFYTTRQTHFNLALVRIVNSLNEKLGYTYERTDHHERRLRELRGIIEKLSQQVNLDVECRLTNLEILQRRLVAKAKLGAEPSEEATLPVAPSPSYGREAEPPPAREPALPAVPPAPPNAHTLAHLSASYFAFVDQFRGSEEEIKQQVRRYLPYFKQAGNVVDLGCGRGEFLEVCQEHHIRASGIDINEDMILYCRRKGLAVQWADALAYLSEQSDKSLDGIFMAYVAEHLDVSELVNLLGVAYRKLQYGSNLVIEAINPASLYTLANNFYLDLMHVRPIHAQALEFLCESCGFRNLKVEYIAPVPPELRLQRLEPGAGATGPGATGPVDLYNRNVDKLNELLFGHQAYAIVGRK